MSLRRHIVSQFERPRGMFGHVAGMILAGRGSNLARNRWTVDLLDPTDGEHVLEIGCGPGVALALCLARTGVTAVGVDHSALMIRQAGKRNRSAVHAGRLALYEGTIDTLPVTAGSFDKAFSINVIQFVDQPPFIACVKRVLEPGATFAITYQPRHPDATRADALTMAARLSELLAAAEFTAVRTPRSSISNGSPRCACWALWLDADTSPTCADKLG
jgi:ubiquinone/menaquinone biosynthesis C-methylase UbiE